MVEPHSKFGSATTERKSHNLFVEEEGDSSTTEEGNMDTETERVETPPFVPETDPDTETERVETPLFVPETGPEREAVKNEPMAYVEGDPSDISRAGIPTADVSPPPHVTVEVGNLNNLDHFMVFQIKKEDTETERVETPLFVPETDPNTETERVETPLLVPETGLEREVVTNEPMAYVEGDPNDISRAGIPTADVSPYVTVEVRNLNNLDNVMVFKMKKVSKFEKLMKQFCHRYSLDQGTARFRYYGAAIATTTTPIDLGIVDGEVIEVFARMDGGHFY